MATSCGITILLFLPHDHGTSWLVGQGSARLPLGWFSGFLFDYLAGFSGSIRISYESRRRSVGAGDTLCSVTRPMRDRGRAERRGSVVVSTSACHAAGRGSLPGPGAL